MKQFVTSNKFDEIESICEELFRDGRMTPEFCGHFFNHPLPRLSPVFFVEEHIEKTFHVFCDKLELPVECFIISTLFLSLSSVSTTLVF